MQFDYDLALQVFEEMTDKEREAILNGVNFLMNMPSIVDPKRAKKSTAALLAVGADRVTFDQTYAADGTSHIRLTVYLPAKNLYAVNIEDSRQTKLGMKTDPIEIGEPPPRKSRNIL